jgi:Ser/Thr protein kinase RdoA (MazF antagonist)
MAVQIQNQGIGSQLIAAAENEARDRDLNFSELGVEKSNPGALRLYLRLGYKIVGENDEVWPEEDDDGITRDVTHLCWLMRKDLRDHAGRTTGPAHYRSTGGRRAAPVEPSRWAGSPSWCPRPRLTAEMLAAVRAEYNVAGDEDPIDIGGSSNLNLHLPNDGDGYVLRVHRAWVTPERLGAIQSARRRLASRGVPFVEPVPARSGRLWIRVGECLAEVERYVVGDDMDEWGTLIVGMPTLAHVHNALRGIDGGSAAAFAPAANHVSCHRARVASARAAAIIRSWAGSPADEAIAASTERLAEELWQSEGPYAAELTGQLVHGDFWDNNVKFQGDDVIGILDLDFMEARPRIDDLALTLYYAYPSLLAARGEDGALGAMATLVGAYAPAANPLLTALELHALPFAIARTALHFTRHVALRTGQREQREVVEAAAQDLGWALAIVRDAGRWQDALRSAVGRVG